MGLDMYLYAKRTIKDPTQRETLAKLTAELNRYGDETGATGIYVSMWDHRPAEQAQGLEIMKVAGLAPMMGAESNSGYVALDSSWASVTATYWRKVNAVHAWFVEQCGDGVDNCEPYPVHPEQLCHLSSLCERALKAYKAGVIGEAASLMEPRAGFFFGSTEVDEWWAKDMRYTIDEIKRVVEAAIAIGGIEFVYEASW